MANKKDWRKEYKEKNPQEESEESNWRDKYKEYYDYDSAKIVGEQVTSMLEDWQKNYNSYVTDYTNRFSKRKGSYEDAYVGDSLEWLNAETDKRSALKKQEDDILAYLNQYGGHLDSKWVKQVFDTIEQAKNAQYKIHSGATKDNEYWVKFTPNDDQAAAGYTAEKLYNEWQAGQKQYAADMAFDIYSGGVDLEILKHEKAMYLKDQEEKRKQAQENESWMDKVGRWLGTTPDTSLPLGGASGSTSNQSQTPYDSQISALEEQIERAKYVQGYEDFMGNMDAADFGTGSQFVSTRTEVPKTEAWNSINELYDTDMLFGDFRYDYINRQADAVSINQSNERKNKSDYYGTSDSFIETMTDDEIGVYNYLYKTQSPEAAEEFLSFIQSDLEGRKRLQEQARWAKQAKEDPFGTSAFSIAISPLKGLTYIGQATDMLVNGKINENAGYNRFSYIPTTIRSQVSSTIENSGNWGKVGSFAYNTGMSMADFLFTTAVSGGNQALSLAIMGSGAAADATLAAKDRGLNDGQAFTLGTIAGLAEVAMEKISLGAWLEGNMSDGALRYILKNALSEGGEEASTSIVNLLADVIIAGDKSEWNMAMQAYIEQGKSEAEAFGLVLAENAAQIGLDALGGALSGSAIGGGTYAGSSIATNIGKGIQYSNIAKDKTASQELVSNGLELNPDSKYIQKMQGKLESGKKLSGTQVRKILSVNQKLITENDMQKIQKAAEKRLTDLGQTDDVTEIASLVAKNAMGQKLTRDETSTLVRSKYGSQVAKEMRDAVAQAEKTAYKPLEDRVEDETPAKVSDTGKAVISGTDQQVDLTAPKIKKITADSVILEVDGKDVDMDSIEFANEDQWNMFNALKKIEHITPAVASDMIAKIDTSKPIWGQMNGMDEAFTYGYYGYSEADLKAGLFASNLTKEQQNDAYKLGQYVRKQDTTAKAEAFKQMRTAAQAETEKSSTTVSKKEKVAKQKTRFESDAEVYFMDGQTVTEFDESGKYDDKRMAGVNYAKFLSKLGIGGKYYFFASYEKDGVRVYKNSKGKEVPAPNGMYIASDGSIYIDLNAGDYGQGTTLFTLGHELTHFIRQWSEAKFKVLSDFLIEEYGKTDMSMHERVLENQRKLYESRGKQVTYDEAFEEVVADAMSTMIADGNLHEKLANLKAKDKDLFAKIKEFFDNLIAKFTNAYAELTPEQRDARDVRAMKESFDKIQTAFAEALVEASENFRAADVQKNTTEDGGVKMSIRDNFYSGVDSWDGKADKTFTVGRTSDVLQALGVKDSEVIWHSKKMAEIMKKHSGMTKDVIKQVPQILEKPVVILASKQSDSRLVIFGTVTYTNGTPVTAILELQPTNKSGQILDMNVIASAYGKDNTKNLVESSGLVYIDPNKKRTKSWMQGLGLQLPSDTTTLGSMGRITYLDGKVKIESVPYVQYMQESKSSVKKSYRNSAGNKLTKEQQEFFKDSKIVDVNGNLKVMYHGSQEFFTVFDKKKARSSGHYGKGFYFTDSDSHAKQYGNTYEVYLNITNPLQNGTNDITKKQLRKFIEAVAENEDYGLDNYGERATVDSVTNSVYGKSDFAMLMDINAACVGDLVAAVELFNEVNGTDYDGIITPTETVAFYPEQIKRTDNKNPTSNPDMRFSERVSKINPDATYAEITEAQQKLYQRELQLAERKRKVVNEPELLKAMDDVSDMFTEIRGLLAKKHKGTATQAELDRIDEIKALREEAIQRVAALQENLGINAISKEETEIREEKEALRVAAEAAWTMEGAQKENKAIEKAGVSAAEYFRTKALNAFKTTTNFNEAGYLLPDGKMLNFSGGERNHRNRDHREIGEIYEATQGTAALNRFLNDGNIRIMAESPGVDITASVEPTREQYAALRRFINTNGVKDGRFFVDLSDTDGHRAGNYSYEGNVNADRVINDIKYFFEHGEVREQSSVAQFRWSERNLGDTSNRSLLANAFEGITKDSIEYKLIQKYKGRIKILNEYEAKLNKLNAEIYKIRFTKGQYDAQKIKRLETEAKNIAKEINRNDKELLSLEASEPLRKVIMRERQKEAQKTKEHIKEIQQNKKDRAEQTELRHKIRKVIRDLDKLLNRGNKKQNVKEDLQPVVTKALRAAEILFTDNYNTYDMLRNGLGVDLSDSEEALVDSCTKMLKDLDKMPTDGYDAWQARQEAESRLDSKMSKLKEVFARERKRLNNTTVSSILGELADAYASLEKSEQSYVQGAYIEAVHNFLKNLQSEVGGTIVMDMTKDQLESLYAAYKMVLTTVRKANQLFNQNLKMSREQLGNAVIDEVLKAGGVHLLGTKAGDAVSQFSWNNMKPVWVANRIGSESFAKLMQGLFEGQYNFARDIDEVRKFKLDMDKKYKPRKWDAEKQYEFESSTGKKFSLNLQQIMSIYAFSKREQAYSHLLNGGFVFEENSTVVVDGKLGIKKTYIHKGAASYKLNEATLNDIINSLTADQKAYVDEMQAFLSDVMGAKGNEVSMQLYGIKMFNEQFYFPLRSSGDYMERAKEAELKKQQGQINLVNSGFTHSVKPEAKNPIVLSGFMDVWAEHCNEMSMYHSMVLPMEDFRKVYNYSTPHEEGADSYGVYAAIKNAYGKVATNYIDQLYRELNAGATVDPRETPWKSLISKFKKSSVLLSASVWVQQFSSIGRAYAVIDPKYFTGTKVNSDTQMAVADEMKKYAPVAIIKEMGGFDTGTKGSAKSYIMAEQYGKGERFKGLLKDEQYRGDIMGYLPAKADEKTWCAIWEAVKRETKANHPKMDVKSEEFLKLAGERFSEVIEKTQVYDSVLARSANMRSKGNFMAMATAFMAEPTTTINLLEDAIRSGKAKNIARAFGSVAVSIVLNNALASIVYAMRDDDDDETFLEKYFQSFTSGMIDDINPMSYYPFLKDVWSLFQGYDVERSDMSVIADVRDAMKQVYKYLSEDTSEMDDKKLAEHNKNLWGAFMSLLDAGCSTFGVPFKNIRRDANGLINAWNTVSKDLSGERDNSWLSFWDKVGAAAKDTIPFLAWTKDAPKEDKLYEAIVSGDKAYIDRLKAGYVDKDGNFSQSKYDSAVVKALRENDPRIKAAAQANVNGNAGERNRIKNEIKAELGAEYANIIIEAINAEVRKIQNDAKPDKVQGQYEAYDFVVAVSTGDAEAAKAVREDIITTYKANGKTQTQAENSFVSDVKTGIEEAYSYGDISKDVAKDMLIDYADMEAEDAADKITVWDFLNANPDSNLSDSKVLGYLEFAESAGVSLEMFELVVNDTKGIKNIKDEWGEVEVTEREQILEVIDSLPINRKQKDAIYLAYGLPEDKIWDVPW